MWRVLFLVACSSCFTDRECTAIGCGPSAHASFEDRIAATALSGATVEVCRNDACEHDTIPATTASDGGQVDFADPRTSVIVSTNPDGLHYVEWSRNGIDDGTAGDRFYVTVTASDGTVLAHQGWTAMRYDHITPNGEDCGGGCNVATLVPQS